MFVTDSLGSPRVHPEKITDEESWVYSVMDRIGSDCKFRIFIKPGLDTNQLKVDADSYLSAYKEIDVVILQVGIVDCYPRAIKKTELSVILRLPKLLSGLIHKFVRRNYRTLVEYRNIRYVAVQEFEENLVAFKQLFSNSKFLVVPIAPASSPWKEKNPKVGLSIDLYNSKLKKVFGSDFEEACYLNCDENEIYQSDNHHLNSNGHNTVSEYVLNRLRTIFTV
ncbi:hypothetical protein [Oceaniserpentilla sp. 4NH20-0058]|uniref:hypothetical protein n=1 Tax=Oceaniserpentilla sp. 4NH20-0058 TaxID=3127660 RepID=UPI00333F0DF4